MKLYRINIRNFNDPLQDKKLLELVDERRRKRSSGIFSLMTGREVLEQVSSSGKFLMKMDFQKMI